MSLRKKIRQIQTLQVKNCLSNSGRAAPNQFEIFVPGIGRVFQSYQSIIAVRFFTGEIVLDKDRWDYSNTTGRYRNNFLGEVKATTQKKIDAGVYLLEDLN